MVELSELASKVYREKASWLGLEADFYVEHDTYGTGEPMRFIYRIVNPTDSVRTLYFSHAERTHFTVDRPAFSGWGHYNEYDPEQGPLAALEIPPGGEETLECEWNQTYDDDGRAATLEPGRYRIKLRLLDTGNLRRDEAIFVDVVDRSIPLAGYIDGLGSDQADHAYTFRLHVRNWTNQAVTLDFPYRERLFIQLYDRDIPGSGPLVFEGPKHPEAAPSSVVLQSGESCTFERTVLKESLNLTHQSIPRPRGADGVKPLSSIGKPSCRSFTERRGPPRCYPTCGSAARLSSTSSCEYSKSGSSPFR